MSGTPDYRRFYTSLPMIRVYDANGSAILRNIIFDEQENQISGFSFNWEPEDDVPPVRTDDGTVTEYPLGMRLAVAIQCKVYSPEFSALAPWETGEGLAFTERDYNYLLKARYLGYQIFFYPHRDRPMGTDARFRVRLTQMRLDRADGKLFQADATISLEGRALTANPLDEF